MTAVKFRHKLKRKFDIMCDPFRPPAVPLIAVDPYFSVWSPADRLTDCNTCHWTGSPQTMIGELTADGEVFNFMGPGANPMRQTGLTVDALTTAYTFESAGVKLTATFTTPVTASDLALLSRPVSYLSLRLESPDGKEHTATVSVRVSEEICLDRRGQWPVETEILSVNGYPTAKMGSAAQPVLQKCGDDLRIDWGYFYLTAADAAGKTAVLKEGGMTFVAAEAPLATGGEALFVFAYDDIRSLIYFGEELPAYWKKDGAAIEDVIAEAIAVYPMIIKRCREHDHKLREQAAAAGGEEYADLLSLAYRQVMAAHKLAESPDGLIFVSKECFSNACAATVDVSYPSMPLFLLENPKLVPAMLRPIFHYAESGAWPFEFAPHDAGCYPHVNGQVYSGGTDPAHQMPLEECGNVLLMLAAAVTRDPSVIDFVQPKLPLLQKWADYLAENGQDPENQLCTDDFAGHMAHNCNLSLKAILGVGAFGLLLSRCGGEGGLYIKKARDMAQIWVETAADENGGFRLAFNVPSSFSMKYNLVWDKLLGLDLFPSDLADRELPGYKKNTRKYGLPLDSRSGRTKSDWLCWTASPYGRETFREMIKPLWRAYHETTDRVSMTDLYDTDTAGQIKFGERGFQHRSVQGGLFIKLLHNDSR